MIGKDYGVDRTVEIVCEGASDLAVEHFLLFLEQLSRQLLLCLFGLHVPSSIFASLLQCLNMEKRFGDISL
ncbi:MAG: hypothetical protein ACPLVJ_02915 [Candidatus Bathyarchaeales archaeon]